MGHPRRVQKPFDLKRAVSKFFLSFFVVFSFILYAAHKSLTGADAAVSIAAPTPGVLAQAALSEQVFTPSPTPLAGDPASAAGADAATPTPPPADTPTPVPQQAAINDLPTAAPAASTGQYKDGTYKGPEIDAFYGLVQVEAIIQNGRIADVKFLEYPSDRRTSVRINNVAVPWLQQEAIQAQSANVNIISGATLTSEGFIMSLGNALSNAHN